jgi:BlaI family transcriptional regulator, penicillinase repressor
MEKLTQQEHAAMLAAWKTGGGIIRELLEAHEEPQPHYNTLSSTVKNLEKKGYLDHDSVANVNRYFPVISEAEYKKYFMGNFVKDYFENSYKELVTFFANEQKISAKDLKEILDMIHQKK